jgi:hypothetical protein
MVPKMLQLATAHATRKSISLAMKPAELVLQDLQIPLPAPHVSSTPKVIYRKEYPVVSMNDHNIHYTSAHKGKPCVKFVEITQIGLALKTGKGFGNETQLWRCDDYNKMNSGTTLRMGVMPSKVVKITLSLGKLERNRFWVVYE